MKEIVIGFSKHTYSHDMLKLASQRRLYELYLEDDENTLMYDTKADFLADLRENKKIGIDINADYFFFVVSID